MTVWMAETSKSTRPAIFHDLRPDERFSICGRPAFAHGHKLTEEEAVKRGAQRCRTCGSSEQGMSLREIDEALKRVA